MQDVVVGRYALGEELGRGGMARVVAARDLRLHRSVAIKLMPLDGGATPDPTVRRRFVREARAAASFTHPHAVAIFDAGDADGVLYLVMELVEGVSLATLLARRGPLGVDESVRLADQVLQALGAAHRAGIVHRDVKPGNVLVSADGVAKLADFGIAKRLDDLVGDLTMTGQFVGTPTYLAPEQVVGRPATPATDLYSAGVLLFEMLANGPPFAAGSPMATALAHRDAPVPDVRDRRPDVPDGVAVAVRTAMAKDPADRFSTADEMRAALVDQRGAGPVTVGTPPVLAPPARSLPPTAVMPSAARRSRSQAWWWLAVAVAVAVSTIVIALNVGDDPPGQLIPAGAASTVPTTVRPSSTAVTSSTTPATPGPAATAAPVTAPMSASTVGEVIALLDVDPDRFGGRADELRRDLARMADRDGRQLERDVERLRGRLADWTADGTMAPEVAALVESVLARATGAGDGGDDDDD